MKVLPLIRLHKADSILNLSSLREPPLMDYFRGMCKSFSSMVSLGAEALRVSDNCAQHLSSFAPIMRLWGRHCIGSSGRSRNYLIVCSSWQAGLAQLYPFQPCRLYPHPDHIYLPRKNSQAAPESACLRYTQLSPGCPLLCAPLHTLLALPSL